MNKYDFSKASILLEKANEQAKAILKEICQKERLFICRECQKKEDDLCWNRRYAIPKKY